MKELERVSKGLNELMIDMTVKCMLNPNNKDFYIGTLTLDKVHSMFAEMNTADLDILTVFWSAYSRAEAQYLEEQRLLKEYAEAKEDEWQETICPECGCKDYIVGVRCPNCDYIED